MVGVSFEGHTRFARTMIAAMLADMTPAEREATVRWVEVTYAAPATSHPLNDRELIIARLHAAGYDLKDIASRARISDTTASRDLRNIRAKLGAANNADLIAVAARAGLLL